MGVLPVAFVTGGRGANRPPWQAKCKNRAPLSLYFGNFYFLAVGRCFLRFSECFPLILGVGIFVATPNGRC